MPPGVNASELSSHKDELTAEQLDAFVEGNAKILDSQQGDLKGNGERGAVLVLDHPGAGNEKLGEGEPRTVLLIVRDGAGKLQKIGKNDRLVPCAQCGGMAGDPFGYIKWAKGSSRLSLKAARANAGPTNMPSSTRSSSRTGCWTRRCEP